MVEYRRDLYRGTAADYDRFRPDYPRELIEALLERVGGRGRALDLACGTGQLARPLANHFATVDAIDQETDTIAFAAEKARRTGMDNVSWHIGRAEELDQVSAYDLIVIGNAFHRVDRSAVAARAHRALVSGGVLALVWGNSPLTGDAPWQRAANDVIDVWRRRLEVVDRVPTNWRRPAEDDPHEAVLRRCGYLSFERLEFESRARWTSESLLGFVYSTSFLNRAVLGEERRVFERAWRAAMADFDPIDQELSFALEWARS